MAPSEVNLCNQYNFKVLFSENHLDWMANWCSPESMSTKTVQLNVQLSTNVTYLGTPQQTAIKQLCYVSCDPNANTLANCN